MKSNFKTAFRRMKAPECRHTLERHKINVDKLWITKAPKIFAFVEQNSEVIKKC